jgi:acyl-CoA synthetase (NDP forming)
MGGWRAGLSKAVGYGNAIDVDEADLYEYLLDDAATDVVVSYIESVGDGRKFIDRARKLDEKKPLLILKSGKGSAGQAAAFSHTGRLAGRYEVFRSILGQFGLNEAADFEELVDAVKALAYQCRRSGSRVCIVTNGGGSGVLAADECMRTGLDVTPLPAEKAQRLRDRFPPFYGIHNPLDLTAQVTDEEYHYVLGFLGDDYDGFIVIALAGVLGISEGLAGRIVDFRKRCGKPVVGLTTMNPLGVYLRRALEREGIPVYPSPERAVKGLKALLTMPHRFGEREGN